MARLAKRQRMVNPNLLMAYGPCRLITPDGTEMVLHVRSLEVRGSVDSLTTVQVEGFLIETGNTVTLAPLPESVRRAISLGELK